MLTWLSNRARREQPARARGGSALVRCVPRVTLTCLVVGDALSTGAHYAGLTRRRVNFGPSFNTPTYGARVASHIGQVGAHVGAGGTRARTPGHTISRFSSRSERI